MAHPGVAHDLAHTGSSKSKIYKVSEPYIEMAHLNWMIHCGSFDEPCAWLFDPINQYQKIKFDICTRSMMSLMVPVPVMSLMVPVPVPVPDLHMIS